MSARWLHRSFPASVLLTRRPTSNYPLTRHHCENPRTWTWGWSTPHPRTTEISLKGVAPQWEGFCEPTVSPVGKWEPKVNIQLPPALRDASQEAHTGLTSQGSLGESAGLDQWGSDRDGEGGWSLQRPVLRSWHTAFQLAVVPEQRFQTAALPICQAKPVAESG